MRTEKHKGTGGGNAVLSTLAGALFALILAVTTLGQGAFSFAYSRTYLLPNWVSALLAAAILLTLGWGRRLFASRPRSEARWRRFLAVYFGLLLAAQTLAVRSLWFYPGWDIHSVYTAAGQIVRGEAFDAAYFAMCPNNSVGTLLLVPPLWAAEKLGLAVPYAVLPYLSAWLTALACLFCVLCVTRLTQSRLARFGALLLCTVWIAFSLTATVPYTDTFSVLFPVAALYAYLSRMRAFPKWFAVSLLCSLGAAVKPTAAILLIALILVTGLRLFPLSRLNRARRRRAAAIAAAVILGFVPGRLLSSAANLYLTGEVQPQGQLCETHYLMLGMNGETYGGHSDEDNAFSLSYSTLSERRAATLREAWRRVESRGIAGNARFFAVKLYKAFSDGMLAADSSYLVLERPARTDALSVFLRSLYARKGEAGVLAATAAQVTWYAILWLCAATFLGKSRRKTVVALLGVTFIGVAAYLMLFEVWPRYLFLYAPLFVVAAALGLAGLRLPARAENAR